MQIRREEKRDYEAVYAVVLAAFAAAEHADGKEQDLVVVLRNSEAFRPELSLVAEEDGVIVGHILFTEITIGGKKALALAPLSVVPVHQKQGIGLALMEAGHQVAADLGYGYSVVLGHEAYYPKAGYVPAKEYGIEAPFDVPPENFMAKKLRADAEPVKGIVQYAKEFGI